MRTWISILFMLVIALIPSAIKAQTVVNRTSIKCMGIELDGSQTLRVIGYGKNRADAKEQAMKNAVWTVIFDGIREGVAGCKMLVNVMKTISTHSLPMVATIKNTSHCVIPRRDRLQGQRIRWATLTR